MDEKKSTNTSETMSDSKQEPKEVVGAEKSDQQSSRTDQSATPDTSGSAINKPIAEVQQDEESGDSVKKDESHVAGKDEMSVHPEASTEQSKTTVSADVANTAPTHSPQKSFLKRNMFTILAIVLVLVALVAVWVRLEQEDRVATDIFGSVMTLIEGQTPVVTVNGVELYEDDLALSVTQMSQVAASQGMDPADPQVVALIEEEALQSLITTELLSQQAAELDVTTTEAEIDEQIAQLEEQAGGAEVLAGRMQELSISPETLRSDVETNIVIQKLLEQEVYAAMTEAVSDEELQAVYTQITAGSEPDAVPPFEEVRGQLELQLIQTRQQSAVDTYAENLRMNADIVEESQ